jgi:hypothetical protein
MFQKLFLFFSKTIILFQLSPLIHHYDMRFSHVCSIALVANAAMASVCKSWSRATSKSSPTEDRSVRNLI